MAKKNIKATHTGELHIGTLSIPCHVLEDGSRVISGRGIQNSLGFSKASSGMALQNFVNANLAKYLPDDALDKIQNPLSFHRIGSGGSAPRTNGYDATLLIDICDAIIDAGKAGKLSKAQERHVISAEVIIRAVAKVGIIALVDEATGFQEVRDKKALQAILDKYLRKELAAWAKRFPDEFYKEMFRLRDWNWNPMTVARPSVVGRFTNDLVYERLAPNILEELERRNPKNESGNRSHRHHQWLTEDIGNPALAQHIYAIITLMKASSKWDTFYRAVQRALPKKNEQLPLLVDD